MIGSATVDEGGDGVLGGITDVAQDGWLAGLGAHDEGGVDEMIGGLCNEMWGGWVV